MAKAALAMAAFVAVFAVLVLVAGSIPPQRTTQAGGTKVGVDRGHVIERVAADRRATPERTNGATSRP
jgi:hypothetical protein